MVAEYKETTCNLLYISCIFLRNPSELAGDNYRRKDFRLVMTANGIGRALAARNKNQLNLRNLREINKLKLNLTMAKIKPMALVESMSKKVCMHSDVYFRTNKVTGVVYTGKLCNPFEGEPSADQTRVRSRFAKVSAAISARLKAMEGTDEYKALVKAYKSQTKIGSLKGYAFKLWNDEYDTNGDLIVPEDAD